MRTNSLRYLPKFTQQQIDLLRLALAAYLRLPPEQCGQVQIMLSSPERLRDALIYAVSKNRLTFKEANEIASIIGASLYRRPW